MRRMMALVLTAALLLSLVSCFGSENPLPETSSDTVKSEDATVPSEDTSDMPVTIPPVSSETTDTSEITETSETSGISDATTSEPEPVTADSTSEPVVEPPVTETEITETSDIPDVSVSDTSATSDLPTPKDPETFDFANSDLSEYLLLGKYLGIEVFVAGRVPVTDAMVEERIAEMIEALPESFRITDRAAVLGDHVSIDFFGTIDGEPFEGGSARNFALVLGSGALLSDLEENIVGMDPGETMEFSFRLPDDYYAGVAGMDAVFSVTLHAIFPELTDEIVQARFGLESVQAYRDAVRTALEREADRAFEIAKEEAAWTKALANSYVIEYPQKAVDTAFGYTVESYTILAESSGMTYETFFPEVYGLSVEEAEEIFLQSSKNVVAQELLLYSIAKDMGLDVSDEKLEADLSITARLLGLGSVDELIAQLGTTRELLKEEKLYAEIIPEIVRQANFIVSGS